MDRNHYFERMREANTIATQGMQEILTTLGARTPGVREIIESIPLLQKRMSKEERLRPFLVRTVYESCGGKHPERVSRAMAAVEIQNISTYVDNAILDRKNGIAPTEISNYLLCGRLLRNAAELAVAESPECMRSLVRMDQDVYRGQVLTSRLSDTEDDQAYLAQYHKRCELLTGASMRGACELGAILSGTEHAQRARSAEFGKHLGILVQIMNDLGDLLPPSSDTGKVYQDQCSDLRNGVITYPIHYMLHCSVPEIEQYVFNRIGEQLTPEETGTIAMLCIDSGAVEATRSLAGRYASAAKRALHEIPPSESRNLLSMATQMCRTTKYLSAFRQLKSQEHR